MKRTALVILLLLGALLGSASAQIKLVQNTAVDVAVGPFLDSTNGVDTEIGLTISQADVRLKKNAAAWAQKNDANACTHEENGWYECSLNTTDTNTVGRMVLAVHESGAVPVWLEFEVIPDASYQHVVNGDVASVADVFSEALPGSYTAGQAGYIIGNNLRYVLNGTADSGTTTTLVDAALTQSDTDYFKGMIVCSTSGTNAGQCRTITAFTTASDTITFSPAMTQAIGTNTYEIHPQGAVSLDNLIGTLDAAEIGTDAIGAAEIAASAIGADEIATDAIGAAEIAAAAITATEATAVGSIGTGGIVAASFGAGAIDAAAIAADAIGSSEVATGAIDAAALAADAGGEIADAVWDEALAGHTTAGTAGKALSDASAAGDPWNIALPGAYGAGTAGFIVGTNLDAAVTTRLAPTTAGRTLDVTATGAAGVDFGNIEGGLGAAEIDADAIGASELATDAIGAAELAADAIGAAEVADGAIDAATLAADTITTAKIADGAITATEVADGAIDAATFAASAITATVIAADAIGASELAADAIGDSEVATGAIATTAFAAGAIDAAAVATDAIGAAEIAADAIASSELATTAVTELQTGLLTVPKNTAYSAFTFVMVDATDGTTLKTGLTPACTVSKDGGALGACTNAVSEIGSGLYKVDLAAADLNADEVWLRFTATGARRVDFKIRTMR